jgi:cytochrome c-type biogenesis protein CcmE
MKKTHIIAIIVIFVAIAIIIGSFSESSTYTTFTKAFENEGKEFHIVGVLDRSSEVIYDPMEDPMLTTFYMFDNDSIRKRVRLLKSKPQDFERSESLVLIGKVKGEDFVASEILMKCPSKYNEGNTIENEY